MVLSELVTSCALALVRAQLISAHRHALRQIYRDILSVRKLIQTYRGVRWLQLLQLFSNLTLLYFLGVSTFLCGCIKRKNSYATMAHMKCYASPEFKNATCTSNVYTVVSFMLLSHIWIVSFLLLLSPWPYFFAWHLGLSHYGKSCLLSAREDNDTYFYL